jgi:hypothetical protein
MDELRKNKKKFEGGGERTLELQNQSS